MTYNTAQKNAAAEALMRALPGMHYRVARAWVTAEQGGNFNALGLTINDVLQRYTSYAAGMAAVAQRIRTMKMYEPILLSTRGGTHRAQALAICRSPWRLGPWGLKQQGGQDPYYTKIIFGQLKMTP